MDLFERIKCVLRQNYFYKKYCQTRVNDCRYWVRNLKYYAALYSWKLDRKIEGHTVYFIIDPNISHPGLIDRLKAIVGTYYVAKQNGFDFKIIFTHPFLLNDYLDCTGQHWVASFDDLSYSLKNTRLLAYNGGGKVPKLNKNVKQYHVYCYIGYDILHENRIENGEQIWRELFETLFEPSPIVKQALQSYQNLQSEGYVAVHLRFVNALEQFEENQFNFLSLEQQEQLIQRCLAAIREIINRYPARRIVVFSDSTLFLNRVRKTLPVIVLDGEIGHVSFAATKDVVLKAFVDFHMMSKAEVIIRILGAEMYVSAFSYYAAVLGKIERIDYWLK